MKTSQLSTRAIILFLCLLPDLVSAEELNSSTRVQVQLNIFSGRPDPVFELSNEEVKNVTKLLETLPVDPESEYAEAAPDLLGYRGYMIFFYPRDDSMQHTIVCVYRTGVEVRVFNPEARNSEAVTKFDATRALEKMLTELAVTKEVLHPFAKKKIDSEVDRRRKTEKGKH